MSPLVDSIDNNTSWNLDLIQKQGRTQGKYKEFMNWKNVYDLSDVWIIQKSNAIHTLHVWMFATSKLHCIHALAMQKYINPILGHKSALMWCIIGSVSKIGHTSSSCVAGKQNANFSMKDYWLPSGAKKKPECQTSWRRIHDYLSLLILSHNILRDVWVLHFS